MEINNFLCNLRHYNVIIYLSFGCAKMHNIGSLSGKYLRVSLLDKLFKKNKYSYKTQTINRLPFPFIMKNDIQMTFDTVG